MSIKAISTPDKNTSLAQLEMFIWGNEIVWGQAVKIGNDGGGTVVVFDDSKHTPDVIDDNVRVAVIDGNAAPPSNAQAFLCQGTAFVGGVSAFVKVYRV